jgi:hypothetical protein
MSSLFVSFTSRIAKYSVLRLHCALSCFVHHVPLLRLGFSLTPKPEDSPLWGWLWQAIEVTVAKPPKTTANVLNWVSGIVTWPRSTLHSVPQLKFLKFWAPHGRCCHSSEFAPNQQSALQFHQSKMRSHGTAHVVPHACMDSQE